MGGLGREKWVWNDQNSLQNSQRTNKKSKLLEAHLNLSFIQLTLDVNIDVKLLGIPTILSYQWTDH